jgi:hypothetical protein
MSVRLFDECTVDTAPWTGYHSPWQNRFLPQDNINTDQTLTFMLLAGPNPQPQYASKRIQSISKSVLGAQTASSTMRAGVSFPKSKAAGA